MNTLGNIPSEDDIFQEVQGMLADVSGADEGEITMNTYITSKLGVDSVSYLDIVMRAEKLFDIDRKQLPPLTGLPSDMLEYTKDPDQELVTDEGMKQMQLMCPDFPFDQLGENRDIDAVRNLFRVRDLVSSIRIRIIERVQGKEDTHE